MSGIGVSFFLGYTLSHNLDDHANPEKLLIRRRQWRWRASSPRFGWNEGKEKNHKHENFQK